MLSTQEPTPRVSQGRLAKCNTTRCSRQGDDTCARCSRILTTGASECSTSVRECTATKHWRTRDDRTRSSHWTHLMYQWNVPTSLDTVRRSMDRRRDVNEYRLQLIRHQQRTDSHTTVVLWHDQPRYSLNHLSFSNALGKDLDSRALSSPAGDTSSTGTLHRHRQYGITAK